MSRIILAVFLLAASISRLPAQEIFYSNEQKFTFQNRDFSVVGWCGSRLYAYRAGKEGYYLDAYNDSMRLLATVTLDFFPQKTAEAEFYATGKEIIVLYQAEQRGEMLQYAAKLDTMGRMVQRPTVVASAKLGWLAADRKYFTSVASNDRSKIFIYNVSKQKGRKTEFNTYLLDNALTVIAKGTPWIASDENIYVQENILANDGTFYMSATGGSKGYSEDAWVFKLNPDGQTLKNITIPLKDAYISGLHAKMDDANGQLLICGFYTNRRSGNVDGIVYGRCDAATDTFSQYKQIPLDEDVRQMVDEKNKKRALDDFVAKDMVVRNDGGFILVAENYFVTTRNANYGAGFGYYGRYSNGYGGSIIREYHYGDIMILSYDGNGRKIWQNFVRKSQYSQDDGGLFSSYRMLNSGGSLVFLFNDFTSNRSTLNLAAVDGAGSLRLKKLNPGRTAGADWIPRSGKQIDIREMMVPVVRKNNLGFARVVF
ncbi:MAG: hypothetical protein QM642_06100 [Edaphocola sp.]